MSIIHFEVHHPNGQRETIRVEGERALIGSAAFCDVRLPVDRAAYEHVLVEVVGATLRAETKADEPEATLNGMPLSAATLPPEAVLAVGGVRLVVSFVPDLASGPSPVAAKSKQDNPVVAGLLLVGFAVAGYLLLDAKEPEIAPPPDGALELFAKAPSGCPESQPEQARAFAVERVGLAAAKRERLPFSARDGVTAAELYDTAAACYRLSGEAELSNRASEIAATLKQDLTREFRARKLRLAHMLNVQDYALAQRDVSVLSQLTTDKRGPYVDWLAKVSQQLERKASR
jgi:hypothetical protein